MPARRIDIPFDREDEASQQHGLRGRVQMVRRFHRPTNLSSNEQVHCVFENMDSLSRVEINGQRVVDLAKPTSNWRCEITELLVRRNELMIEVNLPVSSDGQPAEFTGEIFLAIHSDG